MSLIDLWQSFGDKVVNILPTSPFRPYLEQFQHMPYLGWLNWFISFQDILVIFGAWLSAVAVFYLAQVVLRWLKVIQG